MSEVPIGSYPMAIQIDQQAVSAAFSQPDDDGTFRDAFATYLSDLSAQRRVLLFAFPPKSAGTFLRTAAIAATGGQLVRAVHAQGGREAQLYLPVFLHYYLGGVCDGPMVVHVHMQAHPANCRFIEALGLHPVVMVRSITDMLASMQDMLDTEPAMRIETVNCIVPETYADFSPTQKADFLIDMFAPWYVSFYASWFGYATGREDSVLCLHFSDVLARPVETLERILNHSGTPRKREVCKAALAGTWDERHELRFNRGVEGRGKAYFTQAHFDRLAAMIERYPALVPYRQILL